MSLKVDEKFNISWEKSMNLVEIESVIKMSKQFWIGLESIDTVLNRFKSFQNHLYHLKSFFSLQYQFHCYWWGSFWSFSPSGSGTFTSAMMQKTFSPIFAPFRKRDGEKFNHTTFRRRKKCCKGEQNTDYTCSLWHLFRCKKMWKYEREMSKQSDDKSIESVKVEVHFTRWRENVFRTFI